VDRLEEMKCSALMAVMLADLSRLGLTAADAGNIMNRMILERILGETLHHCVSLSFVSDSLWSPFVIGQTIIFSSCFFFLLLLFFPRLISAVGNWMFTILWHMMWP